MSQRTDTPINQLKNPTGMLDDILRAAGLGQLLEALATPKIETFTVAANTVTLADSSGNPIFGRVSHVEATVGGTTGIFSIALDKAPATTEVKLSYSAAGNPTLLFAGADAVTECVVHYLDLGSYKGRSLKENLEYPIGVG